MHRSLRSPLWLRAGGRGAVAGLTLAWGQETGAPFGVTLDYHCLPRAPALPPENGRWGWRRGPRTALAACTCTQATLLPGPRSLATPSAWPRREHPDVNGPWAEWGPEPSANTRARGKSNEGTDNASDGSLVVITISRLRGGRKASWEWGPCPFLFFLF